MSLPTKLFNEKKLPIIIKNRGVRRTEKIEEFVKNS